MIPKSLLALMLGFFSADGAASGTAAFAASAGVKVIDFAADPPVLWRVVNDGVMGGVSRGGIVGTGDGTALFSGELSLDNNGGFASVRTAIPGAALLAGAAGLEIRVRGDGRRYQLRLRVDGRFDGIAYRAFFGTTAGTWQTIRIPFSAFEPSFRGRVIADAPALDPSGVRQLGLMLADKQPGPFALEIAGIATWTAGMARSE